MAARNFSASNENLMCPIQIFQCPNKGLMRALCFEIGHRRFMCGRKTKTALAAASPKFS